MGFISNLKVRSKLFIAFSIILIITIVVGMNGLITAVKIRINAESFYANNFLPNMMLGQIWVNQEKANAEVQRILYAPEAMGDRSIIDQAVEAVNELVAENDRLLQEFAATVYSAEEQEMVDKLLTATKNNRVVREELIEAVRQGNFSQAVRIYDEKAKALREEIYDLLNQLQEYNRQFAADTIEDDRAEFIRAQYISVALLILSILISIGFALLLSVMIARPIRILVQQANLMADGDFTRELPETLLNRKEEMGMLARAFAGMNDKIHTMLKKVSESVEDTSASSQELSAIAEEVSVQGESINASVQQIAAGMEVISTSIEEVAASGSEITGKMQRMTEQTANADAKVEEIRKRAEEMKEMARRSRQTAYEIYQHRQQEIKLAMEEVAVVEEITKMADAISEIAAQTNLLALNAAIEAARAGDQGLGFAVVAEEVRKLAESSAETASDIHEVIGQVKGAVTKLTDNTEAILKFIEEKVAPDYDMLEKTGQQYAEDALFVKDLTDRFAAAASQISVSVEDIGKSIDSVAATAEEAAASAQEISSSSSETAKALEEVAKTAQAQAEMAEKLRALVANFKV
ncbi:methyl-accepting chemotaxis protein [Thermoclostridium caenicola]|uniref:Methyl-accepting chemotaxis sensory transducer n=1 Tax=Thermoclostridium caenicola TaxID=659425 RepID=A0A1M6J0V6_9FIRM|nr:methyl-accepting chemotaxis protein [Thermoclostridium caenicola]SHJ40307.1 methyl-accepting chemotaxis sensory transducer [Thermoclostridium caenicola]